MLVKSRIRTALVAGLFLIPAGGLMLHLYVHPPQKSPYGLVPLSVCVLSIVVIPWLFCFRKTLHAGYLLNGMTVILGTVTMGHFSIVKVPIIPDILILWAKFGIGYAIFYMEMFKPETAVKTGWRTIRYPNFGFWLVHLAAFSAVYALGATIWR